MSSLAAENGQPTVETKVTSADVLAALHGATGLPIVADYYTRLYSPETVTLRNQPLFEAINRLADSMHLRWNKEGTWLQFRSASFYHDRLKEVPNRLLARLAVSRRQRGMLPLDELIEIARLSDAQLAAADMAEGARECFGLMEWDLARPTHLRPHLRYLAGFTPEQRRMAISPAGLAFTRMSLAQQQTFLTFALPPDASRLPPQEELSGSALHVAYTQPGEFQWMQRGAKGSPLAGSGWRRFLPSHVLGGTREAVLQAARRIDPQVTEAQIVPTRLDVTFLYRLGGSDVRPVHMIRTNADTWTD
jgi:hypothetical protein